MEELILLQETLTDNYKGTFIQLKYVHDCVLFQLSLNQLKFIIRTKTAIGNTSTLWNDDIEIDVSLKYTSGDGNVISEKLDFSYFLLTEGRAKNTTIDIKDFYAYTSTDKTDLEKRKIN